MEKKIQNLIKYGEKKDVEFKLASGGLPKSIFESVCAFLNSEGGYIILGVDDDRKIIGINPEYVYNLKRDFANLCNNSQKIFPTVYLSFNEITLNKRTILYVYVPESSEVHQTNHRIFYRNEDGDYDITSSTALVSNMYLRKKKTYFEDNIYPYARVEDLRKDLIQKARTMALNNNPNHPWGNMSDLELLKSASLYDKDFEIGKEGINLAEVLLFGKDEVIHSVLPYYRIDAICRIYNTERFDDRDNIRTNLLDSYERLMQFIQKHLSDPFYLKKR